MAAMWELTVPPGGTTITGLPASGFSEGADDVSPERSPADEELRQHRCEVFSGYPVPDAWQEACRSVRKSLSYSLSPIAQLVAAAFAAHHERGGADGGQPIRRH
jgi:hypothetical protein